MTNPAFDAARAGGVVDTAVGLPKTRDDMYAFYEFIRNQTRDSESREGGLEFPAGYMFKDVPKWEEGELDDPLRWLLAELDRHGITQAIVSVEDEHGQRAVREFPDRFFPSISINPNEGMDAVRKIDRYAHEWGLKCVGAFPAGLYPQVALNDKKFFPELRFVTRHGCEPWTALAVKLMQRAFKLPGAPETSA